MKFRNLVVKGGSISVDTMLPSGLKVSEYTMSSTSKYVNAWTGSDWHDTITFEPPENDVTVSDPFEVEITLTATIEADPSWGLRDLNGGIG